MTSSIQTPSQVLRKALELLGPEGENWVNRQPVAYDEQCLATSVCAADYGNYRPAVTLLAAAVGASTDQEMIRWNDDKSRTFPEVKAAFLKAIELAEQQEAKS